MLIRVSKCFPICRPPPLSVSPSILTVALPSSPPPSPSHSRCESFSFLTPNGLRMAMH
jgi:hypothetical protein